MYKSQQASAPNSEIIIWDLPLRLFHWSMVLVVFSTAITGYFFPDGWLIVHAYAGYALGFLLIFRIIWGFIGSHYSRFKTFPLEPKRAISHLKSLSLGRSQTYTGHNPVGAWMIVALLSTLILLVMTGLIVWGGEENRGPFATLISYRIGDATEDIHEALSVVLMWIIGIHLVGVLIETKIFNHPVIWAMITGKKSTTEDVKEITGWVSIRGAFIFAAIVIIGILISSQNPSQAQSFSILDQYAEADQTKSPTFEGFSAERGMAFFSGQSGDGKIGNTILHILPYSESLKNRANTGREID